MIKTKYQLVLETFVGYGEGYDRKITTYSKRESAEKAFNDVVKNDPYWEAGTLYKYTDLNHEIGIKSFTKEDLHRLGSTPDGKVFVSPIVSVKDNEPEE